MKKSAMKNPRVPSKSKIASLQTTASLTKEPKDFLQTRGYEVRNIIAQGGFATVYRARMKRPPDDVDESDPYIQLAIKCFDLSKPSQALWVANCLKSEMFISRFLKHPNIVQSCEVLKTHSHAYIVMALAPNGSIATDLSRLKRPYDDDESKRYFTGLVAGLQYMHGQNIAHRDLKLENFLLSKQRTPMIGDFGFAARASAQSEVVLTEVLRKTRCGTRGYMAPELCMVVPTSSSSSAVEVTRSVSGLVPPIGSVLSRNGGHLYDAKAVDVWAMGVCLFEMVNLCKPFSRAMDAVTLGRIRDGKVHHHNPTVSAACRSLIEAMLRFVPADRPKVEQVARHKWLQYGSLLNAITDKLGVG